MKINLSAVNIHNGIYEQTNPKDIFKVLPKKSKKYSYLRDVQAEVLDKWFSNCGKMETVIKMNTGSGKTIVSLLILQSCINQKMGPAVYIVPDNYLLTQVRSEAEELGIPITTETDDIQFLRQRSILLINIHKLFNGKSVFGVALEGKKIDIGTVLIDDAHACIDKIEDQFTITIENTKPQYPDLIKIFEHDLKSQSETLFFDIERQTPGAFLQVPFWTIQSNSTQILRCLTIGRQEDDNIKWKIPLLKEYLKYTDCVVSSEKIEFSIRVIPTEIISSYAESRKIIVSATLPDDTILSRYLDISEEAISGTITPLSASDLGERLIIVPEEINPQIKKDDIKDMLKVYSEKYKVVVIVPSHYRAEYWSDVAQSTLIAENIEEGLSNFRTKNNGLIVLINKYDGIDLPQDECRILVIDELPDDRSEIEKVDNNALRNNNTAILRKIRKIEQGMGRAIRSNDDYSIVLLLGKSLTNYLYTRNGIDFFTPATKQQMKISSTLLEQIHKGTIPDIMEAIDLVLSRDSEWITLVKSSLIGLKYEPQIPNRYSYYLRDAYKLSWKGHTDKSIKLLEDKANVEENNLMKGWLKYYLAQFQNFNDPSSAQSILKSALAFNSHLLHPLEGVKYQRLTHTANQAEKCRSYFMNYSTNTNGLIIRLNSILDDLQFKPETSNSFEQAILELGRLLGFDSQRPENEFGRGPDNLWACGNLIFFVIECKNGCTTASIDKHDTNQINGSINWFKNEYDDTCTLKPILIHPSLKFEYAASPSKDIRIINDAKLSELKKAVNAFVVSAVQSGQIADLEKLRKLILDYKLNPEGIIEKYSYEISV
ncbi:DEAD/DEAH box helicase family protein [Gracilinema caldarium]|uniref:Helicase c2 n=1 Tax=Gracilinema caldarium (strain ATCC 51460 / DSM 7334 / H1) TaxID=744872 RepID=F8F320_GRAC1|nr:DEAD/DEAH box helicase family protein [Gracilinema caldarium]AEJ19928.1 helicase c2 [Gracilinema caldarium DSM 7334]